MYKDGKKWVVAGIMAVTMMLVPMFAGNSVNVFAAEDPAQTTEIVEGVNGNVFWGYAKDDNGVVPDTDVTIVRLAKTDADGKEVIIGTSKIDATGYWEVAASYADAPQGSTVYSYSTYTDDESVKSQRADRVVPYEMPAQPTANLTPTDTGAIITGKSTPNVDIEVKDDGGNVVGTGKTDDKGIYNVNLPKDAATPGAKLDVTAVNGDKTSQPTAVSVPMAKPDAPTVKANEPGADGVKVTGKAEPGADVDLTTADGKKTTAVANDDGDYNVTIPATSAKEGSDITATQTVAGVTSDASTTAVPYHTPAAPTVDAGTPANDQVPVSGTGEPGATVTLTPANGAPVEATVGDDGTFTANVPLTDAPEGSDITATQTSHDKTSEPKTAQVPYAQTKTPVVDKVTPTEDGTTVEGTGEPGATITVTPEDGDPVSAKVDPDGKFKVSVPEGVWQPGETADITAKGNGDPSAPVQEIAPLHAPEVEVGTPVDGNVPVSGTAAPGAEVTVTPTNGDPVTTTADDNGHFEAQVPLTDAPEGSDIDVTQDLPNTDPSPAGSGQVPYHTPDKPTIAATAPDTDGNVAVTGKGEPNASITLTTDNGKEYTGTTDDNGDYTINIPATDAPAGSDITAIQTAHGIDSKPSKDTVPYAKPGKLTDVTVTPTEGGTTISGKGEPGNTATITPENGDPITVPIDKDGNFRTQVPEGVLKPGETADVTQNGKGGAGDPTTVTAPLHEPSVTVGEPTTDGNVPVSGEAEPGAEVTITPANGDPVTTTADDNGHYETEVPLTDAPEGTDLGVTQDLPNTDPSGTTTATVPFHTPAAPTVDPAAPTDDGNVKVTGTGEPGATVTVVPENGTAVSAPVLDDGTYTLNIPETAAPEGSTLTATQDKNGVDSPASTGEVPYAKPAKPTDVTAEETPGGTIISGKGTPGSTITVTPKNGGSPVTVPVDKDGNFRAMVPDGVLAPGADADVTENGKGGTSDPATVTAPYHTPAEPEVEVGEPVDGNVPVSGKGEPGGEVTITPENGDPVTVPVDENGDFKTEIPETDAPQGSKLDTTQTNHGKTSKPVESDVPFARPVAQTPTVADPSDGTVKVTGTGVPGDTITLTPENGGSLTVPVDDQGKYSADIPLTWAPYGSTITAVENGKGGTSDPVTADVPELKLDAPAGTATVPVKGMVTVTGTAAPNAEITLTTTDGQIFTTTSNAAGEFELAVPSTSAPIGSDITAVQKVGTVTSPEGIITVPHRVGLSKPSINVRVTTPNIGEGDEAIESAQERMKSVADHLKRYSGNLIPQASPNGEVWENPRIRLYADPEGKNLIWEEPVTNEDLSYSFTVPLSELPQGGTIYYTAVWHVTIPDDVQLDEESLSYQDENGDLISGYDPLVVGFVKPKAPNILDTDIKNDGENFTVSGLGDLGSIVTVKGLDGGDQSFTVDSASQHFDIKLPSSAVTPGMSLDIVEVNGDKTSDATTITVPEPVKAETTSEPETDPTTEPETDPTTEPETDPTTEPETDPTTEPETDPTTEPETDPTTEPETDPTTEPETDPTTTPDDNAAALQVEIDKLTGEIGDLKTQLGDALAHADDKDTEISKLNDDITKLKTDLGNATSTTGDKDADIQKLNDEIEQLKTDLGNATSTTGDKDAEIDKLTGEIEQLKTQLGNATSTSATDGDIQQLNDEIEQLKTQLGNATSTTAAKDAEIDKLTGDITDLQDKLEQAITDGGTSTDQIDNLTDEIEQLKTQLGNATSTAGDKDAEIDKLTGDITDLQDKLEQAITDGGTSTDQIDNLTDEIAQLKTQLGNATFTAGDKDAEIDKLTGDITDLQTKLDNAIAKGDTTDGDIANLNDTITELQNQLDEADQANTDGQTQITDLTDKITDLQNQLEEAQTPAATDEGTDTGTQIDLPVTGGDTDTGEQIDLPITGGDTDAAPKQIDLPITGGDAVETPAIAEIDADAAPVTLATTTTKTATTTKAPAASKNLLPSTGGQMPQTGNEQNKSFTIVGALAAVLGIFGLAATRRKED
ncbi:hypothetical protein FC18_GL000220 [Lacticaseibacillus sharpeae JCM 1186 = DSM 20505]|uniref:Gram-positive cocci surface proteins LPxTG domain-containing protein n=2 Tax=Lacticaseibacillus sharpeae TaxID=1626 RepID=A0A0R1ZJ84_9LACO|nr:hypothetical protein FC18_GL000220 [Lacticaseibacillus sharpeae JCM 1186 = DSM 20505]